MLIDSAMVVFSINLSISSNVAMDLYDTMIGMALSSSCLPSLCFLRAGCYISRASYVRAGEQSLDGLYKPYHLVVYYRFLRFFPDGECVVEVSLSV